MTQHHLNWVLAALFAVCGLIQSGTAAAQQVSFKKNTLEKKLQFSYQWQNASGNERDLQFSVDKSKFLASLKRFRNYDRKRANRELTHQLNRYLTQQRWRGVAVQLSPRQQSISINSRSAANRQQRLIFQEQTKKLRSYYQQQWFEYLQANHYRLLQLPFDAQGVIPDAASIAQLQRSLVSNLVQQLGEILKNNSRRNYTNLVGQFIQSIPYNALEDGIDNRGDGFLPPNQLLFYNQGDCDSKAALMATILRAIMPQQEMAILYLPGHALFAVEMTSSDNDVTVTLNGTRMVLMEVAGPAMMAAGEVAPSSEFYVNSGQFTAITIN